MTQTSNTRKLTILAQDPAVRFGGPGGTLAFARVDVVNEILGPGPTGYRVKVVDYDASSGVLYRDMVYGSGGPRPTDDPYRFDPAAPVEAQRAFERTAIADPNFHCQNVYAIVMRTLARFEFALGRRIAWSFGGHQLTVVPHAFAEANAFYSEEDKALFFGYFPGRGGKMVFNCLSHDVVAHETTHALLDGLRTRFTERSTPDQAAFHEAFADIVALLSVFSLPEIVAAGLSGSLGPPQRAGRIPLIEGALLTEAVLKQSILTGLAKEFGAEMKPGGEIDALRGAALRRSIAMEPDRAYLAMPEFQEEHQRGEVLVAAFMRAFLKLWRARIEGLGTFGEDQYNRDMVVEEGAKVADHLLTMAIRALDYCPPTDMDFSAYLAALLTADAEVVPEDKHGYRRGIRRIFASYGIDLPTDGCRASDGTWCRFTPPRKPRITYARTNFESMLRDKDEVFRFVWENRDALGINERVPIEVDSVRPSTRQGPDGFLIRETVVTYVQTVDMFAAECKVLLGFERPHGMPPTEPLQVFGGGAIVFDQYGRIKFHIAHRLTDAARQLKRLEYLAARGAAAPPRARRDRFAALHLARAED
jgi:hypothetical protein